MRVLFCIHQYFPRWVGGTEAIVRRVAAQLMATGHHPFIVTYEESPSNQAEDYGVKLTEFDSVPVYEIHYNLSCDEVPARAEYENATVARFFAEVVEQVEPDVAHVAHAMKLSGSIIEVLHSRQIPIVTTLSDFWFFCMRHSLLRVGDVLCSGPDHRYRCLRCAGATHGFAAPISRKVSEPWLWLLAGACEIARPPVGSRYHALYRDAHYIARRTRRLREMLLKSDRIFAYSPFLMNMYVRNGFPLDRIVLMRSSLSDDNDALAYRRRKLRGSHSPLRIITIGPLASFKGSHVIVEALRRVPKLACELVLYGGPGSDPLYVERLVRAAAQDRRIRLPGQFPPDQLGKVLDEASVLAHPALWYENDPIVVKSALFNGLPVLASDLGSLSDLVGPVPGCRLLPAGDVAAWGSCLESFIENPPPAAIEPPDLPTFDQFFDELMVAYREVANHEKGQPRAG